MNYKNMIEKMIDGLEDTQILRFIYLIIRDIYKDIEKEIN